VAISAFIIFLTRDISTNSIWQAPTILHGPGGAQLLMMAVTLIVMAVPEGLPMAVTLALALNMRRSSSRTTS
jgi:Ca2+-transporting ATPase